MAKPHVRFDKFTKVFECFTWEQSPGERCMVTGRGATPNLAFLEWVQVSEIYADRDRQNSEQ